MRSALLSVGTLVVLGGVALLVHFLGIPVRGEPMQHGVRYQALETGEPGTGSIRGQVLDRRGRPLGGSRVVVTPPKPVTRFRRAQLHGPGDVLAETVSDETGAFLLEGIEAQTVRVWAGGGEWLYGMTHLIQVRPGQECSEVTVPLEPRPEALRR